MVWAFAPSAATYLESWLYIPNQETSDRAFLIFKLTITASSWLSADIMWPKYLYWVTVEIGTLSTYKTAWMAGVGITFMDKRIVRKRLLLGRDTCCFLRARSALSPFGARTKNATSKKKAQQAKNKNRQQQRRNAPNKYSTRQEVSKKLLLPPSQSLFSLLSHCCWRNSQPPSLSDHVSLDHLHFDIWRSLVGYRVNSK